MIDSGRSVAEVARELTIGDELLGRWVRDERVRIEAAVDDHFKVDRLWQ